MGATLTERIWILWYWISILTHSKWERSYRTIQLTAGWQHSPLTEGVTGDSRTATVVAPLSSPCLADLGMILLFSNFILFFSFFFPGSLRLKFNNRLTRNSNSRTCTSTTHTLYTQHTQHTQCLNEDLSSIHGLKSVRLRRCRKIVSIFYLKYEWNSFQYEVPLWYPQ